MPSQPCGDLMQHLGPVQPGEPLPPTKTIPRPLYGRIDLLARRDRYLLDTFPRSRVDDPHRPIRHGLLSLEVDRYVLRLQVLLDAFFPSFTAEARVLDATEGGGGV